MKKFILQISDRLIYEVGEANIIPHGYGLIYYKHECRTGVFTIIPFNIIIRGLREIYYRLVCGLFPSLLEMEWLDAYKKAYLECTKDYETRITKIKVDYSTERQKMWNEIFGELEKRNPVGRMKEIIILAMGGTRGLCPFDTETWGVNQCYYQVAECLGRIDKIFLAHTQIIKDGHPLFDWDTFNKLVDRGVEVINTHRVKGLKSKLYPFKRICKKFGTDYFSDTICYMIAYALDQVTNPSGTLKYPLKLRLYGVDMAHQSEYDGEKGGIEYWIGMARGLGVIVQITSGSNLLKTVDKVPYGFKPKKVKTVKLDLSHIESNVPLTTEGRKEIVGSFIIDLDNPKLKPQTSDELLKRVRTPNG